MHPNTVRAVSNLVSKIQNDKNLSFEPNPITLWDSITVWAKTESSRGMARIVLQKNPSTGKWIWADVHQAKYYSGGNIEWLSYDSLEGEQTRQPCATADWIADLYKSTKTYNSPTEAIRHILSLP